MDRRARVPGGLIGGVITGDHREKNTLPSRRVLTPFLLCLVSKYTPLNLTALDWSLLSKKECLSYGGRLLGSSCQFVPDLALMSFILFFGTYSMTLTLKKFKFSRYFPTKVSMSCRQSGSTEYF